VLFAVHDPLQGLLVVSPPERGAAHEQLVEQAPQRPQINRLVVAAPFRKKERKKEKEERLNEVLKKEVMGSSGECTNSTH